MPRSVRAVRRIRDAARRFLIGFPPFGQQNCPKQEQYPTSRTNAVTHVLALFVGVFVEDVCWLIASGVQRKADR